MITINIANARIRLKVPNVLISSEYSISTIPSVVYDSNFDNFSIINSKKINIAEPS